MNTVFQLFQLQEIDTAVDKANKRIKEIETSLLDDRQVKQSQEKVNTCEADYLHQKTLFNTIDDDIQSKKIKKAQSEASLYGGSVANPKELQDLQKESAMLAAYISKTEDELMAKLVELEETEKSLSDAKENLHKRLSEFESQKALLNGEKNQLEHLIKGLLDKRESAKLPIEASVIGIYETLRKAKNGVAVARLQEDSCSSCGSSLTANQCQQARSQAKLFYCPSCGRLLYG